MMWRKYHCQQWHIVSSILLAALLSCPYGTMFTVVAFTSPSFVRVRSRKSTGNLWTVLDATSKPPSSSGGAESSSSSLSSVDESAQSSLTKVPWYAVEAFGKIFGNTGSSSSNDSNNDDRRTRLPMSMQETQDRIRIDNDREYFLSGQIDELIFSPDCVFADPFVSFAGRARFVENLANLGSFITSYSARPLKYNVDEANRTVTTKFMVKLELNLPWKPVLAWPWGVECVIDPDTHLIVRHIESVRTYPGSRDFKLLLQLDDECVRILMLCVVARRDSILTVGH
jgi:hypothetical protein